jgi:hypothetical protein
MFLDRSGRQLEKNEAPPFRRQRAVTLPSYAHGEEIPGQTNPHRALIA